MGKVRVMLADDHPLLTMGLDLAISQWDEFEVVGVAHDGEEAFEEALKLEPDLVIMDMKMPGASGAEAIARIKGSLPRTRILALTTFDDEETVAQALEAGCDGFLLKAISQDKLRASLLSVAPLACIIARRTARRPR